MKAPPLVREFGITPAFIKKEIAEDWPVDYVTTTLLDYFTFITEEAGPLIRNQAVVPLTHALAQGLLKIPPEQVLELVPYAVLSKFHELTTDYHPWYSGDDPVGRPNNPMGIELTQRMVALAQAQIAQGQRTAKKER